MEPAYIIAIAVVVALIVLFVMFRGGIGSARGSMRAKHGQSEFEANGEISKAREEPLAQPHSVNLIGNQIDGNGNTISVTHENASIIDNEIVGNSNKLEVSKLQSEYEDKA